VPSSGASALSERGAEAGAPRPAAGTDLAGWLDAIAAARVLAVGDVMLDRFLYGTVERISPEGPIPVFRIDREVVMLGGAGNVLRNLAALGVACGFVAVVGDDAAGQEVRSLAAREAANGCDLLVRPERSTTIKERYIAAGQQLLRADREWTEPLTEPAREALGAALRRALAADPPPAALVISDYGKGALDAATLGRLIAAARERRLPVVVDPKGRDYAVYRGATVVTPNSRELQEATGLPTGDDAAVVAACRALIERAGVGAVLATRSERGMSLVTSQGAARHLPAAGREVFDVSGAGDTVAAALAAALAAGADLETAARLANVAAGIVVGKLGTAVAHPREILRTLHASDLLEAEAKLVDLEDAQAQAARWRQSGFRIGFTNGCFDLLHPGHVSLLRQARAACDRLVVGLNSDASVRRLKGTGRPVQGEAARAAVLASMASVDLLVVFAEDTPLKLIEALRPDVLVKGADYSRDQVVGADIVERYGGRVLLAELEQGHSTTATIRRLAEDPGAR